MLDRRSFLKTSIASTVLGASQLTGAASPSKRPPNIVFIMADDLGWNELGCYGQEKIRTPNIDSLASEGMRFTQFYAGSAVCAPSRCTLMTGKHSGHAYVRSNQKINNPDPKIFGGQLPLPAEEKTVAELLKSHGYATGCFGKWGLGAPSSAGDPLKQGFDRFYGYNCQRHAHNLYPRYLVRDDEIEPLEGNTRGLTGEHYAPQRIADEMLEFVRENQDKPFFLYYPSVIPHLPLQAPERFVEEYEGQWPETPYDGDRYLLNPTPKACYAGMISFLDHQVGRLIDTLKELGLEDDTLIIFTSDNGTTHLDQQVDHEFFNSVGPLRGLKGSLYEGGIRVPLVAKWPGHIPANTTADHVAANYDVLATLADLVGEDPPKGTDGVSFLPALLGQDDKQAAHDHLYWDFPGYGGQIAVRVGRWKAIKTGLQDDPDAPLELYNLAEDPGESNNVAEEQPEIAKEMEQIMLEGRTKPEYERFRFGTYVE